MKGKQIYWEDVAVGQEIPGYSLKIDWEQVVNGVNGTQIFDLPHFDPDFARAWGHPTVFMNTRHIEGWFSRLLTDWIGDKGFLYKFRMEMRKSIYHGDTMTLKGRVTNKYVQDNQHYVEADVWCEKEREGVTTPCKCTVILPSRS